MKKIFGSFGLAVMLGVAAQAQTTLTAWNFDSLPIGINSSPSPSTGLGTASALGMSNSYNSTNSISNPDVQSLGGSSSGGPNSWRIHGYSTIAGSHGNGWSTQAPIGTQGAEFDGSTFGYYRIKVSFDVNATSDGEANLQVQYSTDGTGTNWNTATITSAGGSAVLATNTSDPNTVLGTFVMLKAGWNNQITVDLTGISGVDNNPNFAIRLVNASTGTSCVDTTGAVYNNTSGNWTFDNMAIQGTSVDIIANWDFDTLGTVAAPYNNPPATLGYGTGSVLGMDNTYNNSTASASADVLAQGGASTGDGSYCWRIRGAPGNGWSTQAPIGTQGAEFDASTAGYSNIVVSFDLYLTTQAESKMCVFYTTNGWATSNLAQSLFYGANASYIYTNSASANTVMGTYFFTTNGQGWYNDMVVDLTDVPGVDNNPQFGIRIVNAATGLDCLNALGTTYNNKSGNCRFDNVLIGGTAGNLPPAINYDPNATVDGPFTDIFTDNPIWRSKIANVYVNGFVLPKTAYNTNIAGEIVFTPAQSPLLQSSGLKNISIIANGWGTARFSQPLAAGVATHLAMTTQAAGPTASGGTLVGNPVLLVADQYDNGTTNPYANVTVSASVGGVGGWTLGGDTTQSSVDGQIAFTNLTATVNGVSAVSNVFITFAVSGYAPVTVTNSALFNIGPPPVPFTPGNLAVFQIDSVANNTTFSIIELNPSEVGQTSPINVVPISATGTNALRMSSSGSTGRLALNDDGTLLCFAAFLDGSAATLDETLNLNRAGVSMNWSGQTAIGMNYSSISLGGSQARAACILGSDTSAPGDWIADDKGGLYEGNTNDGVIEGPNLNNYNNVVVKTFGGYPYIETQKAVFGENIPAVYALGFDPETDLYDVTIGNNLTTDPNASDFYLVSNDGGASYDILYICDQNPGTQGVINKYSMLGDNAHWVSNGSFTNSTGIDGMFATTNDSGGVDIFYTTGSGGTGGNSIIRITDAAGLNQNIDIISSNVIYTASKKVSLKGLTFVPQEATNAPEPLLPPVLIGQNGVLAGNSFTVTFSPDDPTWRFAITGITVNGSTLSPTAYTIQSGGIVFNPAQSALLQGVGAKDIVVTATGYSDDPAIQNIVTVQTIIPTGVSLNNGKMTFSFTNSAYLGFSVLGTNNLAAPVATWPVIGQAVESPAGSGHYRFTDPNSATNSTEFYIIRQP